MSMTREQAVYQLRDLRDHCRSMISGDNDYPEWALDVEALDMAIAAVLPVSREQIEKVWRGEWIDTNHGTSSCKCTKCGAAQEYETPFCSYCGAPMTDEAVQMVMKRLEQIKCKN